MAPKPAYGHREDAGTWVVVKTATGEIVSRHGGETAEQAAAATAAALCAGGR